MGKERTRNALGIPFLLAIKQQGHIQRPCSLVKNSALEDHLALYFLHPLLGGEGQPPLLTEILL